MWRAEQRGLTMIEAGISLVVAGVIASVALPQLHNQLHRSRRADAWAALAAAEVAQERYRARTGHYGASLELLDASSTSPSGHYDIRVTDLQGEGYMLVASPREGSPQQGDVRCAHLGLARQGTLVERLAAPVDGHLEPDRQGQCWPR